MINQDINDEDIVYLLEDDYVHRKGWIDILMEGFEYHLRDGNLTNYSILDFDDQRIYVHHPDPDLNAEKNLLARERSELIKQAIDSLPQKYNEAIVLRHRQEKSYEEISEMLNLPLGTVKARIFRAREMLNKALKDKLSGY